MSFLSKHRVVLGGIAIGLLAGAYQIATEPTVNAGYVIGALTASVLLYGTIGGFVIWAISPKTPKKADPHA